MFLEVIKYSHKCQSGNAGMTVYNHLLLGFYRDWLVYKLRTIREIFQYARKVGCVFSKEGKRNRNTFCLKKWFCYRAGA